LPWTQVPNLATALNVLGQANPSNGGVMFDFWHFFNGGGNLEQLQTLTPQDAALITSLQLNDVPANIADLSRGQNWQFTKTMLKTAIDSIRVMGWDGFTKVAAKAQYPHADAQQMMKDALCSRLMPGDGDSPVREVLLALANKGVKPAIGVEVFNLTHEHTPAREVAQRAMHTYRSVTGA
jgi:sugar phosphate isomerase/epimerase